MRRIKGSQIDGANRKRTNRMLPIITSHKKGEGFFCDSGRTLCRYGEPTLPLFRVKLIISDIYSDACSFLMKDIELVSYVLAEFKDECPYLCRVFKILIAVIP